MKRNANERLSALEGQRQPDIPNILRVIICPVDRGAVWVMTRDPLTREWITTEEREDCPLADNCECIP